MRRRTRRNDDASAEAGAAEAGEAAEAEAAEAADETACALLSGTQREAVRRANPNTWPLTPDP